MNENVISVNQAVAESLSMVEPLLFHIKSAEFRALAAIVGHDEAMIIRQVEYLFNYHKMLDVPNGRVSMNITAPLTNPNAFNLVKYLSLSERTVYRRLDSLRTQYRFSPGKPFDEATMDFKGLYYLTAYENSDLRQNKHGNRNLYWYRNSKLLNQLILQVRKDASIIRGHLLPAGWSLNVA